MKIGVVQLQSVLEPEKNLKTIRAFMEEGRAQNVEAYFLPECFYSMSNGLAATPYLIEGQNEHYQNIKKLATDFKVYLIGGSAATKVGTKIFNRAYQFTPDGVELAHYDKINLFSCDLSKDPSKVVLDEARTYAHGSEPVIVPLKEFNVGISICFDLRFPELYRNYSALGANVLSVSAAFTVPTGKAHWHTLLRARAIENQSYVIASAEWGVHNERLKTFGHSLIIDPWGEILQDAGEGEKLITSELSLEKVKEVRSRLNVLLKKRIE